MRSFWKPGAVALAACGVALGCGGSLKPSHGHSKPGTSTPAADATGVNGEGAAANQAPAAGTAGNSPTSTCPSASATSGVAAEADAVLKAQCVACHKVQAPVFTGAADAAGIKNTLASSVAAGSMPPGAPLAPAALQTIATWSAETPVLALAGTEPPTYEGGVKAMISTKCAWCHSATAQPQNRATPYLTTYATVKRHASDIREQIADGDMPPRDVTPQLGAAGRAVFDAWVAAGYPEGVPPPPIDATSGVFYVDAIRNLLGTYCIGCHMPGLQAPDLSAYAAASAAGALALGSIEGGRMPPSGPLAPDLVTGFKTWVAAGEPYDAVNSPTPPATDPAPVGDAPAAPPSACPTAP